MTTETDGPPSLSEEEIAHLRGKLTAAVRKICPSWLSDLSEDIVQVGLLRVMEVQRKSEDKRTFTSSYLWMTAYCAIVDEIRRHRRRKEVPMQEELGEQRVAPRSNPERHTVGREIGQAIQECLEELVPPRRQAVTLYLLGYRARQVATALGWSRKQAKNLIFRGRQDLRQCLERKGYTP